MGKLLKHSVVLFSSLGISFASSLNADLNISPAERRKQQQEQQQLQLRDQPSAFVLNKQDVTKNSDTYKQVKGWLAEINAACGLGGRVALYHLSAMHDGEAVSLQGMSRVLDAISRDGNLPLLLDNQIDSVFTDSVVIPKASLRQFSCDQNVDFSIMSQHLPIPISRDQSPFIVQLEFTDCCFLKKLSIYSSEGRKNTCEAGHYGLYDEVQNKFVRMNYWIQTELPRFGLLFFVTYENQLFILLPQKEPNVKLNKITYSV